MTKDTVIYGVYIRFWPTLSMRSYQLSAPLLQTSEAVFACGVLYGIPASPSSVEKQHTHRHRHRHTGCAVRACLWLLVWIASIAVICRGTTHIHTRKHTQTGWAVRICLWIPVRIASITVICRRTTHTYTHIYTYTHRLCSPCLLVDYRTDCQHHRHL